MKKIFLGVAIFGAIFVLSGCGAKNQTQEQTKSQTKEVKSGSTISSIKDAMGMGVKMKCEYSMKLEGSDPVKSTAYIEGKKYKSVGSFNGLTQNTIFDGEVMYFWQEGQKTGMKMSLTCLNEVKSAMPQGQPIAAGAKSPEDQFKDATETSCSPTSESVSFSAPADVTFQDQCEMMRSAINKLPAGAQAGTTPSMPKVPNMPIVPPMPAR